MKQAFGAPALLGAAGVLFLAWTSVMLPGFAFPWVNNVFHLPIVLSYAASAEGPHDAFTQSLDNFVSAFWLLFRPFTTEGNAFAVFFLAHLIGRIGFVAGVVGIMRQFGANRITAMALAALAAIAPLFKGVSVVGHTETLATYLSHTGFAISLLPLCWWMLLRGRWVAGACAIGLLFNVNAFLSVWSVAAALVAFWMARETIPDFWRRLALCGLAYAVCASPTVIWMASIVAQPSPPIRFREYLLYYYPYHTFVHVQWATLARYSAFLAAAGLTVWTATRDLGPQGRTMAVLLATYGAVFLLGIPLPYLTDSRLLLNLYPLRIDAVIDVGVAVLALGWAGWSLAEKHDSLPLAIALSLLTGNMAAALCLLTIGARRAVIPLAVLAVVVVLLVAFRLSPDLGDGFLPLMVIFAAAALCAAAPNGPQATIPAGFAFAVSLAMMPGSLAKAAAAAILALGLILALPRPALVGRAAVLASAPATLFGGVLAIGLALSAYAGWRHSVERPDADLAPDREAQTWFRRHTAPDTQFLPVGVNGFSLLSRRPAWVDWQAGAAVMWKPGYLDQWWPRIHAVDACNTDACYVNLARRNGIGWIVAHAGGLPQASGVSERFTNGRYRILQVDGVVQDRGR